MNRRDMKEVVQEAQRQGWTVEKHRHLKFFAPDGKTLIVTGGTQGDQRAMANCIAKLRQAGFRWKGR